MTRKRTRESLEHQLCAPCPACEGRGFVKTAGNGVLRDLPRDPAPGAASSSSSELLVLAHQDVIERLLDEESAALAELEELIGQADPAADRSAVPAATSTTWC